jgi:hypothetical protein
MVMPWWFAPQAPKLWSQVAILGSLWPVLLGIVVALSVIVWRAYQARRPGVVSQAGGQTFVGFLVTHIPPGDLLLPINRGVFMLLIFCCRLFDQRLPKWWDTLLVSMKQLWSHLKLWKLIGRIESNINQWPAALLILMIFGLVITMLGAVQ